MCYVCVHVCIHIYMYVCIYIKMICKCINLHVPYMYGTKFDHLTWDNLFVCSSVGNSISLKNNTNKTLK